jgi:hypothetical protein
MQTLQFSKLGQLLEEMNMCVQLGRKGKLAPVERNVLLCEADLERIARQNKNDMRKAAKRGRKWVARLSKETMGCFGRLDLRYLLEAQQLPLSPQIFGVWLRSLTNCSNVEQLTGHRSFQ